MNTELLLQAALLAYVLSQFTDALLKPAVNIVNLFLTGQKQEAIAEIIRLWPLYLTTAVGSTIAWFTGWNAFDIFTRPWIGQALTAIGIGLGPSFVHDLKPKSAEVVTGELIESPAWDDDLGAWVKDHKNFEHG